MVQKTVLITGCSEGGIGDALAKNFHKKGHRVFATARNLKKVQHLKELGLDIIPLDVTDEGSIKQAVEVVKKLTGGKLDILVNNSGAGLNLPLLDVPLSDAKKMYDVNVFGIISVTQGFAPLLIASKGTIINIGSVAGFSPVPWQGYYNASKASVHLLSHQLRLELSPWGVKVIEIITGGIRTHFWQNVYSSPTLPENSLYLPARKEIESIMQGELIDKEKGKDADVDVYAEAVVSNALKSNPTKEHWVGSNSFIVWFASNFWPQFIWDIVLPRFFNLAIPFQKIKAEAGKAKSV